MNQRTTRLTHPFLARTMTFITYEEIYHESITYQGLVTLIQSLPLLYWVRLASMGHMLLEHHPTQPNHLEAQVILYKEFVPESMRDARMEIYDGKDRVLFHAPQLLALMRLALFHGRQFDIQEDDQKRRDITARCLLGISSLLYVRRDQKQDFNPKELIHKLTFDFKRDLLQQEKIFLMSLLQLYFNHLNEHASNLMGRYKDMVLDIPTEPDFIPNGVSRDLLHTYIQRELGLSLVEYTSLTLGIIVKYLNPEGLFKKENIFWIDRDNYFTHTSLKKSLSDRYFSAILLSQSEYVKEQEARGDPQNNITDFRSFMLRPLVHLDGSKECYPASLSYLQRLMESGLVWVVTGGELVSELRNYWGQVFEHYCHKICMRIEKNSRIKPKYFRELTYRADGENKKSCDAIFVCNDKAVMIEFKVKFINQQNILNADFEAFLADVDKLLIESDDKNKAAAQIDETIRAIRNEQLILPGVNASNIKSYYPLVITLQSWPSGPYIYELIRREVLKRRLLSQDYIAPLEMWSVEEFEYVETLLSSEAIDISTLINDKLLSAHKAIPTYVFLYDNYTNKYAPNKYLKTKTDEMFEIVLSTLHFDS
jgi:hypothetical protein